MSKTLAVRFWKRVSFAGPCWEWMGGTFNKRKGGAYGQVYVGPHKYMSAHRVSYLLNKGPIPKGFSVLHECDNPPCIRPNHLFLGTQGDNCRDMAAKGRHRSTQRAKAGLPRLGGRRKLT